jgi:hypothetical protein
LIAALAPVMPRGSAIVVAVISRLVLTIADLIWAAVAFALDRGMRRDGRPGQRLRGGTQSTQAPELGASPPPVHR